MCVCVCVCVCVYYTHRYIRPLTRSPVAASAAAIKKSPRLPMPHAKSLKPPLRPMKPPPRPMRALLSVCGRCSFGGLGCCSCRVRVRCVCVSVSVRGVSGVGGVGVVLCRCVCVCDLLIFLQPAMEASRLACYLAVLTLLAHVTIKGPHKERQRQGEATSQHHHRHRRQQLL